MLIAHRGNTTGPQPDRENDPLYWGPAIKDGFSVELDVWMTITDGFYLGHDKPQYSVLLHSTARAYKNKIWCHAKNISALRELTQLPCESFWHENDAFTMTSGRFIWTYPGRDLTPISVCVMPERDPDFDLKNPRQYFEWPRCVPYAICSDYVAEIRKNWKD